jgi:hypothetical protein
MAEEQTMTQDAPSGTDGGSQVDQTSYVNDAWDTKYFRSHEAELNPDKAQKPQPKTAKEPVVEPKKAETPKETVDKAKQPDEKQESQQSRFEKAFSGEDGEIDVDKFLSFKLPEMKPEPSTLSIGKTAEPVTKQEDWQKDQEEITKLSKTLTDEFLGPLEKVYQLINQGTDPVQALKTIFDERKAFIDNHLNEEKSKREFQRQKTLEERLLEKTTTETRARHSSVNINEIVSSLPGGDAPEKTALFQEILFGSDVGAKVLDYHFNQAFPDNEKMDPKAREQAAMNFVNGITSDKAKLRFVFESCLDKMTRANLPKILQKSRLSALAADKANRLSAQKTPTGTSKRTAQPAQKTQWDSYLNNHYESADRV